MKKFKQNTSGSNQNDNNKRRWLRFEFASPVLFRLISLEQGEPELESNLEREGQLLEISAGGTLLATERPVAEGNFVSLNLNLKGLKGIEGILGRVKRVEESEKGDFLMGIEFCSLEAFPLLYQKVLAEKEVDTFDKKAKGVISEYILTESKKLRDRVKT